MSCGRSRYLEWTCASACCGKDNRDRCWEQCTGGCAFAAGIGEPGGRPHRARGDADGVTRQYAVLRHGGQSDRLRRQPALLLHEPEPVPQCAVLRVLVGHGVRVQFIERVGLLHQRRRPARRPQVQLFLCLGCAPGRCRRRPGTRHAGARRAGVGGARHRRQGTAASLIRRFGRFGSFWGVQWGVPPAAVAGERVLCRKI